MVAWFLFSAMCLLVALFAFAYWKIAQLNKDAAEAWKRLDNNLKNRAELIPVLSLSAASFEELDRTFVYELSRLKDACRQTASLQERAIIENEITQKFKKVFTVARNHSELEQDVHFLKLQKSIIHAENKAKQSKNKYNQAVREFNAVLSIIPLNLVAKMFEFEAYPSFEFSSSVKEHKL